jgi:hypothetical protein
VGKVQRPLHIDWSSAKVEDGELTVGLSDKPSKKWATRFEGVLQRLASHGSSPFGVELAPRKGTLTVAGLEEGQEPDVRHLLESAVAQVNSDVATEDDEDEDDGHGHSERDRRLTDAFRAFG